MNVYRQCVSSCKDHRANAPGCQSFLTGEKRGGVSDNQSPSNPDKHRQKQEVMFSPGELMFSFLAVYPRHCPHILPDLFFSWFSTLTSFPRFWSVKKEKRKHRQTGRDAARPELTLLLLFSIYFFALLNQPQQHCRFCKENYIILYSWLINEAFKPGLAAASSVVCLMLCLPVLMFCKSKGFKDENFHFFGLESFFPDGQVWKCFICLKRLFQRSVGKGGHFKIRELLYSGQYSWFAF